MNLILSMIFAHVLGDFYFQTNKMAKCKDKSIVKHDSIYTGIIVFIYWCMTKSISVIPLGLFVFATHFIIDTLNIYILKRIKNQSHVVLVFIVDQLLHVSVIIICLLYLNNSALSDGVVNNILLIIVILFSLVMPSSILIDKVICMFDNSDISKEFQLDEGTVIGILERLVILTMGMMDSISGVGFLIAAKTMVRYGQFDEAKKDNNFRSKYLIGTLLSVLLGFVHFLLFALIKSN